MASPAAESLVIDGSHGEGGGQILRTALSLAAITGRAIRIERIRSGRRKPGLAAQHLTAIRAAAAVCGAEIEGDVLGSETLDFSPATAPMPGAYHFDVAEAREGGSAGSAPLVLQTVAFPLALADGKSTVTVRGGTHVPWSPSFDYFQNIWLETLRRLGLNAKARLVTWGFYPAGGGEFVAEFTGSAGAMVQPVTLTERGALAAIEGRAVAASLPAHIAQRMADRARALLEILAVPVRIRPERVRSVSPGAGIFLTAHYEKAIAGFSAFGRRGKPSEEVAEDAVAELLDHQMGAGALDSHLADQILLPLCFAGGGSSFTCAAVTRHLETNAWVIERFGVARITIRRHPTGMGEVSVASSTGTG